MATALVGVAAAADTLAVLALDLVELDRKVWGQLPESLVRRGTDKQCSD